MISLSLAPLSPLSQLPLIRNPKIPLLLYTNNLNHRRLSFGKCRAEFSQDIPFAVAIGASILNSLFFPIPSVPDEPDSLIDSTDSRLAVMGIISFIPYFNWLSWVFAWLDTGDRRYAVYAIVYLAPYIRSNLSLSPEESWLPIASIVLCIIHIQLETSIKNGDLQGFRLLNRAAEKHLSSKKHDKITKEERRKNHKNLPRGQEQSRNEIDEWGVPGKPFRDTEYLNEDSDSDEETKR